MTEILSQGETINASCYLHTHSEPWLCTASHMSKEERDPPTTYEHLAPHCSSELAED